MQVSDDDAGIPATRERVLEALGPLVGLPLSLCYRGGSLRGFGFGALRRDGARMVPEIALHVDCAWRQEGPDGVITGAADYFEPIDPLDGETLAAWQGDRDGRLQDRRIAAWLGLEGHPRGVEVPPNRRLSVVGVDAADGGGGEVSLSGGFRLIILPDGSPGEDWRIFRDVDDERHVVVGGGRITR